MVLIIEAVILGILNSGVYALMASGLTLIFGVMDIINLAIGIFIITGAYLSFALEQSFHLDPLLGLLISTPILFILGVVLYWLFIRRLRQDRIMLSLLVTFAIALILEGVLTLIFTTNRVQLSAGYLDATFHIGEFYLRYFDIFLFLISIVLLSGLYIMVYRTKFGYSLRAIMQNRTAAALIGVDVERVSAITFGIGASLAAVGGVAFGTSSLFNPASSYDLIYRLVVIIVLGGMGSLRGALLASMIMLTISSVTAVIWSDIWSNIVFFALLIVLLKFRPQGLFGQLEGRRQ